MKRVLRTAGLTLLVLFLLMTVGAGTAAAGTANVSLDNAADGETTTHVWNVTVDASASGSLDTVHLNYSGTGTGLSGATFANIDINDTSRNVASTSRGSGFFNVTLSSTYTVDGSETIVVEVVDVTNPASTGTYYSEMELNTSDSNPPFHTENRSFDVLEGGYVNGSVTNNSNTRISGAKVTVLDSNDELVNETFTNGTGNYSHYVPAASYDLLVETDGYKGESVPVTVEKGTENTTDVTIFREVYVNGTVTNSSGIAQSNVEIAADSDPSGIDAATTTTNATGYYSFLLKNTTYNVLITDNDWEHNQTTGVSVSQGNETIVDIIADRRGYVNGTVTNESGQAVGSGVEVSTVSQTDPTLGDTTTTNSSGHYSLYVPNGTYEVAITDDEYEYNVTTDVAVTGNETTSLDLVSSELPGKGTIEGAVEKPDGSTVGSGVKVDAGDTSYRFFNGTQTDSNGNFSLKVPEGTYRVRAEKSGSPPARLENVNVTEGQTTQVTITLAAASYINGSVTNASGDKAKNVFVVADGDGGIYTSSTGSDGVYNITAPPDNYTVSVFASGENADSKSVTTTGGNATEANFSLLKTSIEHKSARIVSGPGDGTDLEARAAIQNGLLQAQLVNSTNPPTPNGVGAPDELETMGVDKSTEFEINVTVTNFSASSLLWGLDDAEWNTSDNATVTNGTDVTIRGSPVTLQANITANPVGPLLFQDPADATWTTGKNDRASHGFNQTVLVGVFDLSTAPATVKNSLNGISVTTNAQRFSTPQVVNDSLRVWIAGPGTTVDGEKHTGFYQATIPDAQLDEWGVDDPSSELNALYKGSDADFTVTETSDGARIRLENISYSAGFVEVEPDTDGGGSNTPTPTATPTPTSSSSSSGGGGGGGSTTATPTVTTTIGSTETPDSTETPTPTATPTPIRTDSTRVQTVSSPTEDDGAGFGPLVAMVALVGATVLVLRRRH